VNSLLKPCEAPCKAAGAGMNAVARPFYGSYALSYLTDMTQHGGCRPRGFGCLKASFHFRSYLPPSLLPLQTTCWTTSIFFLFESTLLVFENNGSCRKAASPVPMSCGRRKSAPNLTKKGT
jgi:hypothetical protein